MKFSQILKEIQDLVENESVKDEIKTTREMLVDIVNEEFPDD